MTRRSTKIGIAASLTVLCAAVAYAAAGRERSLAVYPAQLIPLRFDHSLHLDEGAECETCHDAARLSLKASDTLLPRHPECETCHDIEAARRGEKVDPPAACVVCHPGADTRSNQDVARVDFPIPNLIFDHKVHVDRKAECKKCHTDMKGIAMATRQQLPKMETCLSCHDGRVAASACATCHPTQPSGRLQLSFTSGAFRPMQGNPFGIDHGPRFEFTHGTRASLDRGLCMECHAQNECQTCHDSLQKPLSIHPNDYVTMHPVQARMDSTKCDSCHRAQSFCIACHERTGVGPNADLSLRPQNVKVHPDYATWVEIPGPAHHSIVASRDIKQCMACHREESCMACHATQAANPNSRGKNPHPGGFQSICRALAAKNDRPCLKCHTAPDLSARGCR